MKLISPIGAMLAVAFIVGCGGGGSGNQSSSNSSSGGNQSISNSSKSSSSSLPNEFATASQIELSATTIDSVNINTDDLVDYFAIQLNKAGKYALYLESIPEGTDKSYVYDLYAYMYDDNTTEIFNTIVEYQAFDSEGNENGVKEFTVNTAGVYYLKVFRGRFADPKDVATSYKFHIEPSIENGLIQNDHDEFNDVLSQATPLSRSTLLDYHNAQLNTELHSDHADWYGLGELNESTYVFYLQTHVGTVYRSADAIIQAAVYDENGNLYVNLASSENQANLYQSDGWLRSTFPITNAGKYYVKFSRDYDFATNYSFKVLDDTVKTGDEMATAIPLTLEEVNTTIVNSINIESVTDSDDWYVFSSPVSDTIHINLETLEGTMNSTYTLKLEIVDEYGNTILTLPADNYTLNTANRSVNDDVNLQAGKTYFLHLHRYGYIGTNYKLTLAK